MNDDVSQCVFAHWEIIYGEKSRFVGLSNMLDSELQGG